MNNDTDDLTDEDAAMSIDESPDEAQQRFQHLIKTVGLDVAYKTAIQICQSPTSPAPAKATMVVAIMRAAGAFARADESVEKEPHQMTAAELERAIARLNRDRRGTERARDHKTKTPDDGVFG